MSEPCPDPPGWLVYLDESGDHGLDRFDPHYPVFVLAAVLIEQRAYDLLKGEFSYLKLKYWQTRDVIFHNREIRRREGIFSQLGDGEYASFVQELGEVISRVPFSVIAVIVDKRELRERYPVPRNPYEIALGFIVERVAMEWVRRPGWWRAGTGLPLYLEARGRREDRDLLEVFRVFQRGDDPLSKPLRPGAQETLSKIQVCFRNKRDNIAGLQLADLVAWPIGHNYLHPDQANRAFAIVRSKFRRGPKGQIDGYGRKVFP